MEPDCEVRNWPSALHPQSRLATSSPLSFKHIPCDASLQQWHGSTWKRSRETWLAGSSEPISSCVLTLFSSFALVCSDFSLCAQAFACVLKLPKRLPMCAKSNSQHKDSHLWSANSQTLQEKRTALGLAFRSGVFWVFCGLYANAVPAGCLPCDRAWPAPLLGPGRGSSCCPAQGFSHHSRDCVTPEHQSTPHRDLHHESMSQKFENTFPIPTNPEYNWFEELLKMLSDRAGQGLKTP